MLWLVSQVHLKVRTWLDILKLFVIVHLTLNHRKHSITHAHYWEMLIVLLVVTLGPVENLLDRLGVGVVAMGNKRL